MKKGLLIISVLLAACMVFQTAVFAEELSEGGTNGDYIVKRLSSENISDDTDSFAPAKDQDGKTNLSLVSGFDDALASTGSNHGYGTVEFTIPDTQCEVYLTGMKEDIGARVQQTILSLYSRGVDFNLTEDFIDAEKTRDRDSDDNMCWAACAANVLRYSGWGYQAGFASEDDIFEDLIKNFENKTGNAYYAFAWFFNGLDLARDAAEAYGDSLSNNARVKTYPRSGGYLKDYTFDKYAERFSFTDEYAGANGLKRVKKLLNKGCGVILNTDVYMDGRRQSGHSVTCWGMITDNQYPDTDKAHYKYVFVTNSDSDQLTGNDRRKSKNVMSAHRLTPFKMGSEDSFSINFDIRQLGVLSDVISLEPYIAGAPVETDPAATRDRIHDVDFLAEKVLIVGDPESEASKSSFAVGESVYYGFVLRNMSSVPYDGKLPVEYVLKDDNGNTVKTSRHNIIVEIYSCDEVIYVFDKPINKLKGGRYTMTVTWNPGNQIREAFFFNNNLSYTFTVGEPFLRGDVDNDNAVTNVDSVYLQRILNNMETGLDAKAPLRGDVNSTGRPDLTDVSMIQRFCVRLPLSMGVHVNTPDYY